MGEGPVWQAVFLADPDKIYRVYYGATGQSKPPRYDLVPIERLLSQDHDPVALALGPEAENPHFRQAGFFASETRMRILFGLAIVVMVAVLAAGLYRASRQVI